MKNKLIIEGVRDRYFFEALISQPSNNLSNISVEPKGCRIGAELALSQFKKELERALLDTNNLAIVIDADAQKDGKGFNNRYNTIKSMLDEATNNQENGTFTKQEKENFFYEGDVFIHTNGAKIGLWIMHNPDTLEGMLEDFLIKCMSEGARKEVFDKYIDITIDKLIIDNDLTREKIIFNLAHINKVKLNTWFEWLKNPDVNKYPQLGVDCAINEGWLNPKHDNIKALTTWLTRVFQ